MKEQKPLPNFWFVWAKKTDGSDVALGVSAYTELNAKRQARKCLGASLAEIRSVGPVKYSHAWVLRMVP